MIRHSFKISNLISNVSDTADGFNLICIYENGNMNANDATACIWHSLWFVLYTLFIYKQLQKHLVIRESVTLTSSHSVTPFLELLDSFFSLSLFILNNIIIIPLITTIVLASIMIITDINFFSLKKSRNGISW